MPDLTIAAPEFDLFAGVGQPDPTLARVQAPEGVVNTEEVQVVGNASGASATLITPGTQAAPAPDPNRPAWLPEKFKSVEDMAAAYKALETKLGTGTPAAAPAATEKPAGTAPAPEAAKPAEAPQKPAEPSLWDKAQAEAAKGAVSPETLAGLEKLGVPKSVVESVAATAAFAAKAAEHAVYAKFGGESAYKAVLQTAATALTPGEKTAINAMFASGDFDKIMAGADLLALKVAGGGTGRMLPAEGASMGITDDGYKSAAEMNNAQMDPRYGQDEFFTKEFERKSVLWFNREQRKLRR